MEPKKPASPELPDRSKRRQATLAKVERFQLLIMVGFGFLSAYLFLNYEHLGRWLDRYPVLIAIGIALSMGMYLVIAIWLMRRQSTAIHKLKAAFNQRYDQESAFLDAQLEFIEKTADPIFNWRNDITAETLDATLRQDAGTLMAAAYDDRTRLRASEVIELVFRHFKVNPYDHPDH